MLNRMVGLAGMSERKLSITRVNCSMLCRKINYYNILVGLVALCVSLLRHSSKVSGPWGNCLCGVLHVLPGSVGFLQVFWFPFSDKNMLVGGLTMLNYPYLWTCVCMVLCDGPCRIQGTFPGSIMALCRIKHLLNEWMNVTASPLDICTSPC